MIFGLIDGRTMDLLVMGFSGRGRLFLGGLGHAEYFFNGDDPVPDKFPPTLQDGHQAILEGLFLKDPAGVFGCREGG